MVADEGQYERYCSTSRDHYNAAVREMAYAQSRYPDWMRRLITHRLNGLDSYMEVFHLLAAGSGAIKVVIDVTGQE